VTRGRRSKLIQEFAMLQRDARGTHQCPSSAYVSIRQHTSAYVSTRQRTCQRNAAGHSVAWFALDFSRLQACTSSAVHAGGAMKLLDFSWP
jgi:hypothetical protein